MKEQGVVSTKVTYIQFGI